MTNPNRNIRMTFTGDEKALLQAIRSVQSELSGLRRSVREGGAVTREHAEEVGGLTRAYQGFGRTGTAVAQNVGRGMVAMEGRSSGAARKVSGAVANLALNMVGLQGATGKLTQGLLTLAGGSGVFFAVAAAVAVAGAAYRAFTADTRAAREEQEKLAKSVRDARLASLNQRFPALGLDEQRRAAEGELAIKLQDIARLEERQRRLQQQGGDRGVVGVELAEKLTEARTEAGKLREDIGFVSQELADLPNRELERTVELLAGLRDRGRLPAGDTRIAALQEELEAKLKLATTDEERLRLATLLEQLEGKKTREKKAKTEAELLVEIAGLRVLAAGELVRLFAELDRIDAKLAAGPGLEQEAALRRQRAALEQAATLGFAVGAPERIQPRIPRQEIRGDIPRLQGELNAAVQGELAAERLRQLQQEAEALASFVEGRVTDAFSTFFDRAVLGAENLGEVVSDVIRDTASQLGRMVFEDLGKEIGDALRPKESDVAGAADAAAQAAALTAGAAAVDSAGNTITASAAALGIAAIPTQSAGTAIQQGAAALTISAGLLLVAAQAVKAAGAGGGDGGGDVVSQIFGSTLQVAAAGGFALGGPASSPPRPRGPGDTRLAWLDPREFVINPTATAKHFGLLQAINAGLNLVPGFAEGGPVDAELVRALSDFRRPLSMQTLSQRNLPAQATAAAVPHAATSDGGGRSRLDISLAEGLEARLFESDAGERAQLRVLKKHRKSIRRLLAE